MPIKKYPTKRNGAYNKKKFSSELSSIDRHFDGPSYSSNRAHALAGGEKSVATLGPGGYIDEKSDANSKKPGAIVRARAAYPKANFKAGHLLNASFGGAGNDAQNLTILTSTGNTNHKSFDEPVKKACTALLNAYEHLHKANIDIKTVKMGIKITVEVTGNAWGNEPPDNCIFDELTCAAALLNCTQTKSAAKKLCKTGNQVSDESEMDVSDSDDEMSDEPDPDEVKALTAFFAECKKIQMYLGQANASSSIANTCLPKFR